MVITVSLSVFAWLCVSLSVCVFEGLSVCLSVCLCVRLVSSCRDESSQFLRLIAKPGRQFIEFDDFLPLIQV